MACTKRRKKNIEQRSLLKPELKQVCWNLQKHQTPVELRALSIKKKQKVWRFFPEAFFFLKTRRDSSLLNLLSVLTIPPRRLVQSLPLSGCSHGNHQVSRQAWKARQGTCDSLHMLRQHTLSDNRRLTPSHFFFFLSFFFKLASTQCSHKKAMFGESWNSTSRRPVCQSICLPPCLSPCVTHPHTHTHKHTHAHK